MKNLAVIFLFCFSGVVFAEEGLPSIFNPPALPTLPNFTRLPPPPPIAPNNNQANEPVRVVKNQSLIVTGAFLNGNTRNNVANTITNARFILFSNGSEEIRLSFTNAPEYIYFLRNPRARVEISEDIFRETFDTFIQVGREFLLGQ